MPSLCPRCGRDFIEVRDFYYCPNCRAFVGGRGRERTDSWEFRAEEDFYSLAASADGSVIVAGCHDNNIYCFDRSGSVLWKFKTDGWVYSVAISADGESIVVGSQEKVVHVLDRTGRVRWQATVDGEAHLVSISRTGDLVSVITGEGTLFVLDHKGDLLSQERLTLSSKIFELSICDEHRAVFAMAGDVHVVKSGQNRHMAIGPHKGPSSGLGICADGSLAAWGTGEGTLSAVDAGHGLIDKQDLPAWERKFNDPIRAVKVTKDGSMIAIASGWDLSVLDRSGGPVMHLVTGGNVHELGWSGDGSILAAGAYDDEVYVIDGMYHFVWSFPSDGPVHRLAMSDDGNTVVVAHEYGKGIRVFNPRRLIESLHAANARLYQAFGLQQAGNNDAAGGIFKELGFDAIKHMNLGQEAALTEPSGSKGENLNKPPDIFMDLDCPKCKTPLLEAKSLRYCPNCHAFPDKCSPGWEEAWRFKTTDRINQALISPDNSYVVAASMNYKVVVIDIEGKVVWEQKLDNEIWSVSTSSGGSLIGAGTWQKFVLFDRDGKQLRKIDVGRKGWARIFSEKIIVGTVHEAIILDPRGYPVRKWNFMYQGDRVLIPESGKSLIQCAEQKYAHGTLVAYNEDGQMIWRVFQDIAIDDIAISADGKYIPYAHAARLYMLDGKGQRLWDRPVGSGFQCVTIAKDGSWVAGGGKSGNVMAFDSSGNLMWKYHTEMGVNRISISPDGQFVLAGSLDSNIYLLNKQGRLVFRSLLASTPYSLTMANDLSSISVGTQDGTLYCLKYTDHAELIKDANEALHQAGASEKAGYYDKAIEKYEKLGIVPEILRNYSNWIALMKQQGKPEEASRLKEKMRPWQKLARTRKKTPKQEEPGQPLIIGPAGDQKPVEPPSDRFRDISKVESRWKGLEKRLREYIQIDLDRRENSYKWEKRESAANPTTTSSYNIFPLARMKLVINGTDAAKALYCEGSELFLVGSQFRKDVPPGYLDDHELTFRIYLGKGMDAASNAAAVIADKILVKSRGSKGSFETHRKSELAAQDFISGNRSRAAQHCEEVFDLTKNAGVIPDRVPTSGKTGLFTFSYAFARCQIIDGLLKKEPGLVKGGLEYYSLLLKAGIASYSTSSENFAEEELIVLYDIALSLGMKIDVQTPFIPPSILENGYWYKPLS